MTPEQAALIDLTPAFALILLRVSAAMALLPGLGEAAAPAVVRVGLALGITVLLVSDLRPLVPPIPDAGLDLGLMALSELVTGLWFGWIARMIALALPMAGQFIGYLVGLSSVLQPDAELGSQSGALGKLFETAAPVVLLVSGLYKFPVIALTALFQLVPPGHILPATESVEAALRAVGTAFALALQLASPFVVIGLAWHVAVGLMGRLIPRLQTYFVSVPGQIMVGLTLVILSVSTIILAWKGSAEAFFINVLSGG